eukprot:6180008-Pleurochrysis_carterae.AAC.3
MFGKKWGCRQNDPEEAALDPNAVGALSRHREKWFQFSLEEPKGLVRSSNNAKTVARVVDENMTKT